MSKAYRRSVEVYLLELSYWVRKHTRQGRWSRVPPLSVRKLMDLFRRGQNGISMNGRLVQTPNCKRYVVNCVRCLVAEAKLIYFAARTFIFVYVLACILPCVCIIRQLLSVCLSVWLIYINCILSSYRIATFVVNERHHIFLRITYKRYENHATIAIQSIMYFIAQQRRIKSANAKYIMQTPDGLTLH